MISRHPIAELALGSIGGALAMCALGADQQWLDRHFLSTLFVSRQSDVFVETLARIVTAALGTALAFPARRRIGYLIADDPPRALHAAVAVVLAVGASELILRQLHLRAAQEETPTTEPRRRFDSNLGWIMVPARTGHHVRGGRDIEYAFDSAGYRVCRVDEPVDPERPTIVFTGESIMVGEGLTWEETVPAQTGAMMGIQSANLAVSGFSNDQAYLRLRTELPRFRQPIAVVSLFAPALFDRNLDDDRPHLGVGLAWLPPKSRWRLASIAKLLIRYHSVETIERGITSTREVLRATVDLAHARGAASIIVVPEVAPEQPGERALRHRVLDEAGLPYVRVELDPSWRVPGDRHPNSHAARAMATAIVARLREGA